MLVKDRPVAPDNPLPIYVVGAPIGGFKFGEPVSELNPLPSCAVDPLLVPNSVPTVGCGASLSIDVSSFVSTSPVDTVIGTLSQPYGVSTTYVVVGAKPAQIKLSDGTVQVDATASTVGETYVIKIRALSADGSRETAESLSVTATGPVIDLTLQLNTRFNAAFKSQYVPLLFRKF